MSLSTIPKHGLIRYIGERDAERRQVDVDLNDDELARVRDEIITDPAETSEIGNSTKDPPKE